MHLLITNNGKKKQPNSSGKSSTENIGTWYPCERCPPWGRSRAMILSWGFNRAV